MPAAGGNLGTRVPTATPAAFPHTMRPLLTSVGAQSVAGCPCDDACHKQARIAWWRQGAKQGAKQAVPMHHNHSRFSKWEPKYCAAGASSQIPGASRCCHEDCLRRLPPRATQQLRKDKS